VTPLIDRRGRRITRLRLAVSDQCNLACMYCRPRWPAAGTAAGRLLSVDEIAAVAEAAVACGIEHLRLTGGEPLLREGLHRIVHRLSRIAPELDLSLTTNGILLETHAEPLAEAGLSRVNVSLDSLREDTFRAITGGQSPSAVRAGLRAAERAGLRPIKLNAVVLRGLNDDEVIDMVRFAQEHAYHLRFIEFMPLDGGGEWRPEAVVSIDEVRARIEETFGLTPLPHDGSPGDDYVLAAGPTRVSLIGTISHPFCDRCNRVRVTADGFLRPCLFSSTEADLRPALASARPTEALVAMFAAAAAGKPDGHGIGREHFVPPRRSMFAIGG
jgi:cyclic pyranopterin phosphate synthase